MTGTCVLEEGESGLRVLVSNAKAPTMIVGAAMKRMENLLLDSKSFFVEQCALNIFI